jgi:hypothetical protein
MRRSIKNIKTCGYCLVYVEYLYIAERKFLKWKAGGG